MPSRLAPTVPEYRRGPTRITSVPFIHRLSTPRLAAGGPAERLLEVVRERLLALYPIAGDRMGEGEPPGVEEWPGQPEPAGLVPAAAVATIPQDRMPHRPEVHPDLMGPSRPGASHQERGAREPLPDLEVRDRI